MNMDIIDAFELSCKLAAVINRHAQRPILQTYEQERRNTALTCIERSRVHMRVHIEVAKAINGKIADLDADTDEKTSTSRA